MPVVSTEKTKFEGIDFTKVIKVDSDGEFSIELPPLLVKTLQLKDSKVRARTKDLVLGAFSDQCNAYRKAKTTTRKVILYRGEFSAHVMSADGKKALISVKDVSFSNGMALDIGVGVYDEIKVEHEDNYHSYRYNYVTSDIPKALKIEDTSHVDPSDKRESDTQVLDWTKEREAFFANMGTLLQGLIIKLHDMSEDRKKFAALTNQPGGFKLLR